MPGPASHAACAAHAGIVERQKADSARIADLEKDVYGNGTPGLKSRLQKVEDWLEERKLPLANRLQLLFNGLAILVALYAALTR